MDFAHRQLEPGRRIGRFVAGLRRPGDTSEWAFSARVITLIGVGLTLLGSLTLIPLSFVTLDGVDMHIAERWTVDAVAALLCVLTWVTAPRMRLGAMLAIYVGWTFVISTLIAVSVSSSLEGIYMIPLLVAAAATLPRRAVIGLAVLTCAEALAMPFLHDGVDPFGEGSMLVTVYIALTVTVWFGRQYVQSLLAKLERAALTDALTELPNRRGLAEHLGALGVDATAPGHLAYIACDIDHFKAVNDTFGHEYGDRVLCAVAEAIARIAPSFAARVGGEEFVLICEPADVDRIWEQLQMEVAAGPEGVDGLPVTLSAGVSTLERFTPELRDEAARTADDALYRAKRAGRNQLVRSTPVAA